MVVTDNDVKKLEKRLFFSISFLESNKKKWCGAFKTDAAVPEKQLNTFFCLNDKYIYKLEGKYHQFKQVNMRDLYRI